MKYRSKVVVIDAWRYHDDLQLEAICERSDTPGVQGPHIHTLEGPLNVSLGDWVIRGLEGEFYPCKDSVFQAKYEPADESPAPAAGTP